MVRQVSGFGVELEGLVSAGQGCDLRAGMTVLWECEISKEQARNRELLSSEASLEPSELGSESQTRICGWGLQLVWGMVL